MLHWLVLWNANAAVIENPTRGAILYMEIEILTANYSLPKTHPYVDKGM